VRPTDDELLTGRIRVIDEIGLAGFPSDGSPSASVLLAGGGLEAGRMKVTAAIDQRHPARQRSIRLSLNWAPRRFN